MAVNTSIKSPADVANYAFSLMGFRLRLGSLLDGSDHAQHVLDTYGQTRDSLMSEYDYDFASANVDLVLLKSAPVAGYFPPTVWSPTLHPPAGFLYEYDYPSDALKIRSIRYQPLFPINFLPRANNFTEYNDPQHGRTVVCNVPNAIATYTRRVTDPTTWDVTFASALAAKLAAILGPALVGLEPSKVTMLESGQASAEATVEQR